MPQACVLYSGYEFADSSRAVKAYLISKGFNVHMTDLGASTPISSLPAVPGGCDVSVWLSHGGWDGPMVFAEPYEGPDVGTFSMGDVETSQVDAGEAPLAWQRLREWVATHIRPEGVLVAHSCHSAGSNRYESTDSWMADRWVHEVARDMNVYAVGVEGSTASANRYDAVAFLRYALEGQRWKQASRAYRPGGQRVIDWSGWLNK